VCHILIVFEALLLAIFGNRFSIYDESDNFNSKKVTFS
jgi:hypothetical protein